jgi:hypothetical protein
MSTLRPKSRTKIIHFKKQIKSAGAVTGISVIFFIFFCAILFGAAKFISHRINADIIQLNDAIQIQENIVTAVEKFAKSISSETYEVSTTKVLKDSDKSFSLIKNHVVELSLFTKYYFYIFIAFIVIQLLLCFFLYRYMISFTHRIYGPEKVILSMLRNIAENKPFTSRRLRKNDMLKDIFNETIKIAEMKNLIKK